MYNEGKVKLFVPLIDELKEKFCFHKKIQRLTEILESSKEISEKLIRNSH